MGKGVMFGENGGDGGFAEELYPPPEIFLSFGKSLLPPEINALEG